MAVKFDSIADLKRQPGVKGFPVPMAKQMAQGAKVRRPKIHFPKPDRVKK